MPCLICQNTLSICPCEYPKEDSVDIYKFGKYISKTAYNVVDLPSYVFAYKKLIEYCPCKECLVKMQCCSSKLDQLCKEYKELVGFK